MIKTKKHKKIKRIKRTKKDNEHLPPLKNGMPDTLNNRWYLFSLK